MTGAGSPAPPASPATPAADGSLILHTTLLGDRHCHVVWGPSKFDREAEFA